MKVSAWKDRGRNDTDTNCAFGLNVGKPNRRTYFEGLAKVEIDIDGQLHLFSLQRKTFWDTCPELRDEDTTGTPIRNWLERHKCLTWPKGNPPRFELTHLKNERFRLRLQ